MKTTSSVAMSHFFACVPACVFMSIACLLVSCHTDDIFAPANADAEIKELQEKERIQNLAAVRARLESINDLIGEKQFDEAEELLLSVDKFDFCKKEVAVMRASIREGRMRLSNDVTLNNTVSVAERELGESLGLSSTYGKTVVIDPQLSPLELPQGSMEDLINKKVSMNLNSATVGMLVDFLNDNGFNAIADDALSSEKTLTMRVQGVPLKEVLSYIARNMGIAFYIGENMVWITEGDAEAGPRLETRILRLRRGLVPKLPASSNTASDDAKVSSGVGSIEGPEDTELNDVLTSFLEGSPEGSSFQIFPTRNILVIRNTRENIRFVEEILRDFDKPPLQVAIEARFITISQNDLRDIGVQITNSHNQDYTDEDVRNGTKMKEMSFLSDFGDIENASTLGLSGVIGKRLFDVVIQAIDNKESSITLNAPRLTVMNNRTARIRKGEVIYYFDEYDIESIDNGDSGSDQRLVPSGDPVELPLGLTFDVSVNVGNDHKTIMLGLRPEFVKLLKWEDYLTTGDDDDDSDSSSDSELTSVRLPRTHQQGIITTVNVQSGETVVLGGLMEDMKSTKVQKIPFLGDIPILGWLFKRKTVTDEPTSLLIFVTARVLNDRGEFVQVQENGKVDSASRQDELLPKRYRKSGKEKQEKQGKAAN